MPVKTTTLIIQKSLLKVNYLYAIGDNNNIIVIVVMIVIAINGVTEVTCFGLCVSLPLNWHLIIDWPW